MRRINATSVGIDQGSLMLFSDFESEGPMWAGEGSRETRQAITFSEPFAETPVVHVSISLWDTDRSSNQRADIRAENVTRTGFAAVFRTWGDTRVARIRCDWLAIGALADPDQWDVP